jgi:bacterial DNA-binding protein
MNKTTLVNVIYNNADVTRDKAEYIADAILENIKHALIAQEDISFKGVLSIITKTTPERMGRNVRTGEEVLIPEQVKYRLRVSKNIKDVVNGKA